MSRLLALDTETTGLKSKEGDRIIELAMVEISRSPDAPYYHQLFNPDGREIAPAAMEVHGHTPESLADKPLFAERIEEILQFIGDDATMVIHNAGFDLEFLRDEFMNAGLVWNEIPVIDTLKLAAKEFPGGRHSLDALCNRFGIDLSKRVKHGALIDTRLLAELYLAWKGQSGLDFTTVSVKRSVIPTEALGSMNDARVIVPRTVIDVPPAPSWTKHFEGIEL